ncbi:MAG: OmpA family protein [Alphaproteobacteria bacterium]|nr:OmpA family protein [Alphaproteobacteria bacterium]MBV9552813.1 OmpA family protein [Alphaproteobacteria bacterium]
MNAGPAMILTVGCALGLAAPALAQSAAPTQSQITNALRAVPPAMQSGDQGLPTPGTAPLATPARQATPTSLPSAGASGMAAKEAPQRIRPVVAAPGCAARAAEQPKAAVNLPTIVFEFGSARLQPQSMATLQNLGKSLKEDFPATNTFLIEGHTDSTGSFAYNQELSRARAEAVKDYLTHQGGMKPEQLGIAGFGYCDLANPANPRGAENRRVVVVNQAS